MSTSKTQGGKWAGEASTNIFYFASLKEIKWKVFESANISLSDEPSHPVIRACSKLFHASRLVTWHLGRNGLQLWVFYWPTDDIDLTSINLLKEVQHGMWDNGLPSDCLSHLYKAVHQHFERVFFKMSYARVGKYFVKADGTFQQSFQIGFFIHGDHHLCASIELRDKMQVHFLKKSNLDSSQKLKVVLMPIGVECSLTGIFLNPMSETLHELEEVFPAYQMDRNDPVNCHKMFLVETVISGYTMLYPASHILIVNDTQQQKPEKTTLGSLNDEVAGVISSEGEVTSATTTSDCREQVQQAVWKETGFWTYKPPPDNVKCTKHQTGARSTVVESCTSITKRARTTLHKKRLQRSVYRSNLERNKYRDDKSPVLNLPTLPIKTSGVSTPNAAAPATKPTEPLPRLQPAARPDFLMSAMAEHFDSQPLTIECVENTACRDESALYHSDLIPGSALSQALYKIPLTTQRKPLPTAHYDTRPVVPVPCSVAPPSELLPAKRPAPVPSSSPLKKIKVEPKTDHVEMYNNNNNTPVKLDTSQSEYKSERQKVYKFTHETEIAVHVGDLDEKLFESDPSDTDDDETQVLDQNMTVLPESCLTPDTLTDPKCILSPTQGPTQYMNPQFNNTVPTVIYTPPSNDPSSYDPEEIVQNEDAPLFDKRRESYYQLLFDQSSYSALALNKSPHALSMYTRAHSTHHPSQRHIMLNSPQKTPEQTARGLLDTDITAELDAISAELKDIGALPSVADFSRTLQMSVNKDEVTLQSIGEKIMQNPDQKFVFPSTFAQAANIKKELSDLPKLQGGQFLIKFGDSHMNKFVVNSEDLALPGGYSCIVNESKSVLLDMSRPRMEIYAQNDHKSTVGYLPKSSISISLYQSVEVRTTEPQNVNPFAAVKNSVFSPSFLKILQELVRNVPNMNTSNKLSLEDRISNNDCINTVGRLLESRLPSTLVLQKPRTCILPWKSFSSLAEKFNSGGTEQPLPSVVVGNEEQWISVSPMSVPLWLSKGMQPYAGRKDLHYLVVTPENPHILNNITYFFKELSTAYELCHLGHHKQLVTQLRDGIMRVGKRNREKVANEPCDPWFTDKNDPESSTWQIYAKTCHPLLAKFLTRWLGEQGTAEHRSIVIYFIDPFQTRNTLTKAQLITRCFNSMKQELNKIKNTQFIMQCIPVDYVSDHHKNVAVLNSTLKSVCFSVYNQTLKNVKAPPLSTCLTGFGPVSDEAALEGGEQQSTVSAQYHIHTPLFVLNTKPYTEVSRKHDTLFCAYCLSHDSNWVIVALTDGGGHMVDTAVYAVDEPTRQGGVPPSVLTKIWTFCLTVVENYRAMWSIVVTKMGNVTDAEDHVWSEKFKCIVSWNAQLQERCPECVLANKVQTFGVASACLLSVLSTPHVHILPLLNRPRTQEMNTSSHVVLLPQQQPVIEPLDRYKKVQEDSFTFYSGPDSREKRRKILCSAYLASSSHCYGLPKHMGNSGSSVLLSNYHHNLVLFSKMKHVLCSDNNHPQALRYILQKFDALSWLQISPASHQRLSPLPLHMLTIANIYSALEGVTYVPP